jgi:hypothetical protein
MSKIQSFLVFLGPRYRFGFGFPFRFEERLLLSWFLKLKSTVLYERLLGFRDTFSKLYCYNPEKSASSLFWRGAGSFLIAKAFHSFQIVHISRPFFQIPFFWSYVFSQQLRFLFLFDFFLGSERTKPFLNLDGCFGLPPEKSYSMEIHHLSSAIVLSYIHTIAFVPFSSDILSEFGKNIFFHPFFPSRFPFSKPVSLPILEAGFTLIKKFYACFLL